MRCPGQDTRYWKDKDIFEVPCPHCGSIVEFFKDDTMRVCKACGEKLPNPKLDFGCALHCKFAEQCLGTLPKEIIQKKQELLKDRVAIEMKRFFGRDFRQISHAGKVARYAERIARKEGADLGVVLCAAYLHDLGAPQTSGLLGDQRYLEQERLSVLRAEEILGGLGAPDALVSQILEIIGHHHHPRSWEPLEFKCLYDGDVIANFEDQWLEGPKDQHLLEETRKRLMTKEGQVILEEVLKRIVAREG